MEGGTDKSLSGTTTERNGMDYIGENPESAPVMTAKKKSRRKERSRKQKVTSPINPLQGTPDVLKILEDLEALTLNLPAADDLLNSSTKPVGSVLLDMPSEEQSSAGTDRKDGEVEVSPKKKRNRKKRNVAIDSIQKLSETSVTGHHLFSNMPTASCNTAGTSVTIQSDKSAKTRPNKTKKPAVKEMEIPINMAQQTKSKNKSKQTVKKMVDQPSLQCQSRTSSKTPPPPRKKVTELSSQRTKPNKAESAMLNENKFENHLQRELVEVMLKEQDTVLKGFIRINQRNYREAYIRNPDGSRDILIDGVKDRNRALEGDEVVVLLLPQSQWKSHEGVQQKVGKVIHILSPVHHREAVGSLKKMQDGNHRVALFSPRDSRVPRMQIPMKECPKNPKDWENCLFHARIVDWIDVRFAKGQLMGDSIGNQGDVEAETRAILLENEINYRPYDEKLYSCFPKPPYKPSDEDLCGREDLRSHCIFTIDPLTAKDLDDAVSCEKLENGNFKVGVHISDVTFFLKEGTLLDKEVSKRAVTTYLVQRAYHMLPRELTMMCSLLPGEDKLAFSVFWEMTPEAEVISHKFTRSVINSCSQLAYEHAQAMIDDPNHEWKAGELPPIHGKWKVEDLRNVVLSLQSLAVKMRKRRFDSGAIRVDQMKLMFHLGDSGEPDCFSVFTSKDSHRLIEEFMLLANITVAKALYEKYPHLAFLRCHDEPQGDMLKKLTDQLEKCGIILDTSSAGSLHESLQKYNSNGYDPRFMALNSLLARPMSRARYFCAASIHTVELMKHYALNVPLYTHFTSPIRRYADVMVHRLLSAYLGYNAEPEWSTDYVNDTAAMSNKMKFCAKRAGEQSSELFLALWLKKTVEEKKRALEEEAVVVDVKDHSFDAIICSTGTNIRVYVDKLAGSFYFDNTILPQLHIVWTVAGGRTQNVTQVITMFSVVKVGLRTSNTNQLKIEATLLPPK